VADVRGRPPRAPRGRSGQPGNVRAAGVPECTDTTRRDYGTEGHRRRPSCSASSCIHEDYIRPQLGHGLISLLAVRRGRDHVNTVNAVELAPQPGCAPRRDRLLGCWANSRADVRAPPWSPSPHRSDRSAGLARTGRPRRRGRPSRAHLLARLPPRSIEGDGLPRSKEGRPALRAVTIPSHAVSWSARSAPGAPCLPHGGHMHRGHVGGPILVVAGPTPVCVRGAHSGWRRSA
jgi:hypothetical protein